MTVVALVDMLASARGPVDVSSYGSVTVAGAVARLKMDGVRFRASFAGPDADRLTLTPVARVSQ